MSQILQVGSADHHVHYYDLRNISQPLYVFSGHTKAVSYVKFLSNNELASGSTDSTLRLWDVKENLPVSYSAHDYLCHLRIVIFMILHFSSSIIPGITTRIDLKLQTNIGLLCFVIFLAANF